MFSSKLECDGDDAILRLTTHFNKPIIIRCKKQPSQTFRLSYTAVHANRVISGVITKIDRQAVWLDNKYNGIRLNDEQMEVGEKAYAYDYYHLLMEDQPSSILISKLVIEEPRLLFVNIDALDGAGNLISRHRCSPYTGDYLILNG